MNRFIIAITAGILTIAAPALAERLNTDALADAVTVTELETSERGHGSVVVVGMLRSDTERLLERIQIALIVRDSDGEELGREGAQVLLLPPGESAPFRLVFKEKAYPGWDRVEPLVWRARSHPGEATPALETTITREVPDPAGSSYIYEVHGTVTNTDDRELEWVEVDAAFRDGEGRLIGVGHDSVGASLGTGESADFSIGINTAGGEVASTRARAYARPVER